MTHLCIFGCRYHDKCFWATLKRARSAKPIETSSDIANFDSLEEADKKQLQSAIREFKSNASPARKKKMAAAAQKPMTAFFGSKGGAKNGKKADPGTHSGGEDMSGKFSEYCELVEKVSAESSHLGKTALVKKYVNDFSGDLCLLFKLLLPHKDIDRRTYNLKDKSLVKILARLLGHSVDDIQVCSHTTRPLEVIPQLFAFFLFIFP